MVSVTIWQVKLMASVTCGKRTMVSVIMTNVFIANVTEPPYHPFKIIEQVNTITATLSLVYAKPNFYFSIVRY